MDDNASDELLLAEFADACGAAWTRGLVILADTLATLLSILVGGFVWWVLLIAAFLGLRHWRRTAARGHSAADADRQA